MSIQTKETLSSKLRHFLRGAGSVLDLQPDTRRNLPRRKQSFTRTVFIGGRKYQLDAERDSFKATAEVFTSDWGKITGDVERATMKLPAAIRDNAARRLAAR